MSILIESSILCTFSIVKWPSDNISEHIQSDNGLLNVKMLGDVRYQ